MVKKIRRKLKVVKKVKAPGTDPSPDAAEEVEEMVDGEETDDRTEEGQDETSDEEEDEDLGLAKTVTGPTDASETARRMKDLIAAGASGGQMDSKKGTEPGIGSTEPVTDKGPKEPLTITKVEKEPVKATATATRVEPAPKTEVPEPKPTPTVEEHEVPIAEMEPFEEEGKEADKPEDQDDEDFDKHREAMASTLDLQEKVMREIEADLFKKEEEVRDKLEEIKKENPEGLNEILTTVQNLDKDTIKDFVAAAETLYEGQFDKLPGDNEYWSDLKKKAGMDAEKAAAKVAPAAQTAKRDKAEEYRRREKAIDIFKKSVFQNKGGVVNEKLMSPLKARMDTTKDKSSHFFGPAIKVGPAPGKEKKEGAMTDFLKFGKADVAKTGEKGNLELEKSLAETRLKLADAEKSLAESKMEIANLRATQGDRLSDLDNRVHEMDEELSSKEKEISELKTKLEDAKKGTTKFLGQKEMTAEIDKLNRVIENLNYDIRTKNDVILGLEAQVKNLEVELERHMEISKQASTPTDDKTRLEQLEELKIREEEVKKLETRTQKNLEELKEIAKDNMKSEYRLKRKEMLLENLEKNVEYQKREIDKRSADVERSRNEIGLKIENLDAREKEVVKKEEDLKLNKERIEQELENLEEQRKKIKNDLMEQARMDYRLDKRQQEIRLQEMKAKQLEDAVTRREQALTVKEAEFKSSGGGLDMAQIDEVLKMKTAELARKEEALKAREDELELKRRNLETKLKTSELDALVNIGDKDAAALIEKLKAKETEMVKREDELRKLETSLKDKWAQLQVEAKRMSEVKASGGVVGAQPAGVTTVTDTSAEIKPLLKVRCVGCRELIPIYSTVRPLKVQCPKCSKVGVLK